MEIKNDCFDRVRLTLPYLSRPSHHRRTSLITSCVAVSSRFLFDIRWTAAGDSRPTHEDCAILVLVLVREALKTAPKEPSPSLLSRR